MTRIGFLFSAICLALCVSIGVASMEPTQAGNPKPDDRDFVTKAAIGNMAEVSLGKIAVDRATNPDVKQFAQRMIGDHTAVLGELKNLASQKSLTVPDAVGQEQQSVESKLSKLSGAEFDREYMKEMLKGHKDALSLFEKEAATGADTDLKAWSAKTVEAIKGHLRMAQDIAAKLGVKD